MVTEENKIEYVQRLCYAKMAKGIEEQLKHFLQGFHELVPPHLVKIFTHQELELMISGLPEIDLMDLKENTEYHNYSKDSNQIIWFWEVLDSFDRE